MAGRRWLWLLLIGGVLISGCGGREPAGKADERAADKGAADQGVADQAAVPAVATALAKPPAKENPDELLRQAKLLEADGKLFEAAVKRDEAGQALLNEGQNLEAIEVFDRTIAHWRSVGEGAREARALNLRGLCYYWTLDHRRAEADFELALEKALRAGEVMAHASAISNLGMVRQAAGNLGEARQLYENALELLDGAAGLEQNMVNMLRILAQMSWLQGERAEAWQLLARAKSIQEANGLEPELILSDQAWVKILDGSNEEALELLRLALANPDALEPMDEVLILDRLGTALVNLSQVAEARATYRLSLDKVRRLEWKGADLGILTNLCRLAIRFPQQEIDEGDRDCEALKSAVHSADPNRQASAYHWYSQYLAKRGNFQKAFEAGERSIELQETLRSKLKGPNKRSAFLEDRSTYFRRQVDLYMQAHHADPHAGYDLQAIRTSERMRARSLLELWVEPGIDPLTISDQGLIQFRDDRLRESVGGRRGAAPALDLAYLHDRLDDGTALVDLVLGAEKSYLWIIGRDGIRSFDLPPEEELQKAATEYLGPLANPRDSADLSLLWHKGYALHRLLWGEQEERLEGLPPRLVFVGDGELQQFPISALPRRGSTPEKPKYLIDDFEVVHLPALSVLDPFYSPPKNALPTRSAILLADPLYRLDSGSPISLDPLSEQDLSRFLPGGRPDYPLGRLPFAALEAERIVTRFGPRRIDVALGPLASKSLVLSPRVADYSIVHLTSHGWGDSDQIELSGVQLSEVDEAGRAVDGKVRLQDLYSLRWRAQLVVASACQTGIGGHYRLEGVGGLAQGFFHVGARRALVSLWQVESESTAYLMDQFYRQLLAGTPPGSALRAASLELRRQAQRERRPWESPFYWAPFVLIGDWSSFEIPAEERN